MVWGGGSPATARERQRDGADVVAWLGADPAPLLRAGVVVRPLEAVIGDEGLAAAATAARTWARLWGRVPLADGEGFREVARWRETSLLWLAEDFIRRETAGPRCAELADTALRVLAATGADEVDTVGLVPSEAALFARACTARGVLFHGRAPKVGPLRSTPSARPGGLRALGRLFAGSSPPPAPLATGLAGAEASAVLVVRGRQSDTFPPESLLLSADAQLSLPSRVVPSSDLARWETRRVRRDAAAAERHLRAGWKRLRGTPGLLDSYRHRGVGFSDLAGNDLERIMLDHLPAAVLRLEAAIELLGGTDRPAVVVLAGLPRDERRGLLAACAVARVPALVLHPAPVGPEEIDREDGGPRADATLVWEPGDDPAPVLARLGEVTRANVSPE